MTDKQIIKTLKNIKDHCNETPFCYMCRFRHGQNYLCQIDYLDTLLSGKPAYWDMELIERVLSE